MSAGERTDRSSGSGSMGEAIGHPPEGQATPGVARRSCAPTSRAGRPGRGRGARRGVRIAGPGATRAGLAVTKKCRSAWKLGYVLPETGTPLSSPHGGYDRPGPRDEQRPRCPVAGVRRDEQVYDRAMKSLGPFARLGWFVPVALVGFAPWGRLRLRGSTRTSRRRRRTTRWRAWRPNGTSATSR